MYLQHIREIKAIDMHAHLGTANPNAAMQQAGTLFGAAHYMLENMKRANIALSVASAFEALMPCGAADAVQGNKIMLERVEKQNQNVYMLAVVNPLQEESFALAAELLQHPKCLGIKLHPTQHRYSIKDYGTRIYTFAAKQGALLVTHSGEENCMPEDFCFYANRFPEVNTVVAHLGYCWDGRTDHQMIAIEENIHGNLYTDTSSFKALMCDLLEQAVARIGSQKILFGTDSGIYFSPAHRARVDSAYIDDADKENILYRNALKLLCKLKPIYETI